MTVVNFSHFPLSLAMPNSEIKGIAYEDLLNFNSLALALVIDGAGDDEAVKAACDALTNAWQPELTMADWLRAGATRLGIHLEQEIDT